MPKVEEKQTVPEWKPKYLEAFICLMLTKLGGFQSIELERLEKYPDEAKNLFIWEPKKKCFTAMAPKPENDIVIAKELPNFLEN